jgi:hypothetical protein
MLKRRSPDIQDETEDYAPPPPPGGTRAQIVQRLQVGFAGLGTMIMVLGLASMVTNRANQADSSTVPDAMPAEIPRPAGDAPIDPLAEAGVVPDVASGNPDGEARRENAAESGRSAAAGTNGTGQTRPLP